MRIMESGEAWEDDSTIDTSPLSDSSSVGDDTHYAFGRTDDGDENWAQQLMGY